jgi:uncharacterized protein
MPLAYGLIHPVDLTLQHLPPALQGLRIAHLSDLHITRPRPRHDRLISQLSSLRLDMVLYTGDYMMRRRDCAQASQILERIAKAIRPRLGHFGVFGNHDSSELAKQVADIGIHWLGTAVHDLPDAPIQLLGIDPLGQDADDGAAMLLNGDPLKHNTLRLMLTHYPSWLSTAADLNAHILFAGHTHGGQIRLPNGQALNNACDLPRNLSSGILRHRNTLIAISRGLGEVGVPYINKWRIFCPPHVPVYTLRQGSTLGCRTPDLVRVVRW